MTSSLGEPLSRTATGYLRTEVYDSDSGFLWYRSPGALRDGGFRNIPQRIRAAVDEDETGGARLLCGADSGAGRLYRVDQPVAVGKTLLAGMTPDVWADLARDLAEVGSALRHLHGAIPASSGGEPPVGAGRLAAFMGGRTPTDGSVRLAAVFADQLTEHQRASLLHWCEEACGAAPRQALLHGAPSLGAILTGVGRPTLLFGEELAVGPPEYDVAWLLGELWELRMLYLAAHPHQSAACIAAEAALVTGYGADRLDREILHRLAVVRVATHAHDFATYVGWVDQLTDYVRLVANLIDENASMGSVSPVGSSA